LPVLVLVVARPEFMPPWSGRAHVTTLSLTRLTRREGATLVDRVTDGKALPDEVLEQILARTDGIPLFVEELTKTVLESGLLREEAGLYALTGPLPPLAIPTTLQASLLARLDRPAAVRQVAQIGAAIGREFSYPLLDGVAKLDSGTLRAALNELVRSELVFSRGEPPQAVYTFKHALVRDAAYDTLLRGPRQELHARIATVLENRFPEEVEQQPELLAQHCTLAGLNERAIAYWSKAGRKSAAHSAMIEAAVQFRKGLELLPGLPDGPDRQREELDLQSALGAALAASKGASAPETGRAYDRARALCEQLGDTASVVPVLMGQFAHHINRGELAATRRIAEDLLLLGQTHEHAAARLAGNQAMGACMHHLGEFAVAVKYHDQVLALYQPEIHQTIAAVAGYDPRTIALGLSSCDLFILGYPDQARSRAEQGMIWGRHLHYSTNLAATLNFYNQFNLLCRAEEAALEVSGELISLMTEQGLGGIEAPLNILRGPLLASTGNAAEGLARARKGMADRTASGSNLDEPYYLGHLAQTCERAGLTEEALDLLVRALEIADRTGGRMIEAELHRLRGDWLIAHRTGDQAQAEACFNLSLAVARRQRAKIWELRAATSLGRLWRDQGRRAEASDLLAPVYSWFTEGFQTVDLTDAKALLDELA
jgi:predicted ATPase